MSNEKTDDTAKLRAALQAEKTKAAAYYENLQKLQAQFDNLFDRNMDLARERDKWKEVARHNLKAAHFMKEQAEHLITAIDAATRL